MPTKIVDLSARSEIIRDEPIRLHFWECTPFEFKAYLARPREFLESMGIKLPLECRIETIIENHDGLAGQAPGSEGANDTTVCNLGGGTIAGQVYRVLSYARDRTETGQGKKRLLHKADRQQVKVKRKKNKAG